MKINKDTNSYVIVIQEKKAQALYSSSIGLTNSNSVLWEKIILLAQCGISQKHKVFP